MTDTTMLERAARAVLNACPIGYGMTKDESEIYARAVLMAVREPDGAVFNRANEALFDAGEPVAHETVHAAMIDAILADGEGK